MISGDWLLEDILKSELGQNISQYVQAQRKVDTVVPASKNVLNPFKECSLKDCKIVIIGEGNIPEIKWNPGLETYSNKNILWLNSALTTGTISHLEIWKPLMREIIKKISNDLKEDRIFILLNTGFRDCIDEEKHYILEGDIDSYEVSKELLKEYHEEEL
jgi:uracil DNA glycosylase